MSKNLDETSTTKSRIISTCALNPLDISLLRECDNKLCIPAPPFEPFDPLEALAKNLSTKRLSISGAYLLEPADTRYYLALVPTVHSWEAPAYFDYGGWNACPHPQAHVAMQHLWHTRYGAEIVILEFDIMDCRVLRPPQTREFAWAVAYQQMMYDETLILEHYNSIEQAAADLIAYPIWTFGWRYSEGGFEME